MKMKKPKMYGGGMSHSKPKKGYKTGDGVKKHSIPSLDELLIKKKKLELQIEMAKKKRYIKGRPSQVMVGKRMVKKGGKV